MAVTDPYAGFEGRVGRTFAGSEPWWPPRAEPPEGAPNVVVMLVDDLGYSRPRLLRLGDRHPQRRRPRRPGRALHQLPRHADVLADPVRRCSPGSNRHRAGVGHVAHSDPGFPGYAMELTDDAATLPEIFRDDGYATFMVGKWHLAKDSDLNAAGPQHSWPCQRGFDRFYGFLDGFTNLHQPHRLIEDNHAVEVDRYPDGYYLTDDLTDRACPGGRSCGPANPASPSSSTSPTAPCHAPLHAKAEDIERYRGALRGGVGRGPGPPLTRQQRARRRRPPAPSWRPATPRRTTTCGRGTSWPTTRRPSSPGTWRSTPAWSTASTRTSAACSTAWPSSASSTTPSSCFTSDNGASREGEEAGTSGYFVHLLGQRRRRRRSAPASTCSAARRPCPTTRGAGPWRRTRRSGSTRSTPTPAATRCRSSCRGPSGLAGAGRAAPPVRPRRRPAAHAARAHGARGPDRAPRPAAHPDGGDVVRGDVDRRRAPARPAPSRSTR